MLGNSSRTGLRFKLTQNMQFGESVPRQSLRQHRESYSSTDIRYDCNVVYYILFKLTNWQINAYASYGIYHHKKKTKMAYWKKLSTSEYFTTLGILKLLITQCMLHMRIKQTCQIVTTYLIRHYHRRNVKILTAYWYQMKSYSHQ